MQTSQRKVRANVQDAMETAQQYGESALDSARGAIDGLRDETRELIHSSRDHLADFGGTLGDTIRKNPVPALLVGLGIGIAVGLCFRRH
jgi:hypothetical protein